MTVPQRISYVTLGARNMAVLRAFYASLGWRERPGSNEGFTTYEAGPVVLALFPLEQLGREAAPGASPPAGDWSGVTLGLNVEDADTVDRAYRSALDAGAQAIAAPTRREWGGYSAYIADPEGNRWEITWAPGS